VTAPHEPLAWPWPADTTLDRSRRLCRAYRDALSRLDAAQAAGLDRWALQHGERWLLTDSVVYEDNDLLTLAEVAEVSGVKLRTVYQWHQRGLKYTTTAKGPRVRYDDLIAFERNRRLRRLRQS
jgi:hypothetical protein